MVYIVLEIRCSDTMVMGRYKNIIIQEDIDINLFLSTYKFSCDICYLIRLKEMCEYSQFSSFHFKIFSFAPFSANGLYRWPQNEWER